MNDAEVLARRMAEQTSARSETAQFVRMDGRFAVVNIGTSTITIPCVGVYPPQAGLPVRVDWVNGSAAVTGLVTPQNPFGTIAAPGTPRASVLVDGSTYDLFVMEPYVPEIGDPVAVDWDRNLILGKVSGIDTPEAPGESGGGGSTPFDIVVRASDSNRYDFNNNNFWGNDPWASNNNMGVWVYGNRVKDAVAGATISAIYIYLPLISETGSASIGVHGLASISGVPSIVPGSLITMPNGQRNGWFQLTNALGDYLSVGSRGVGVVAPGGGYTRWRGTAADGLSGALRIVGTI